LEREGGFVKDPDSWEAQRPQGKPKGKRKELGSNKNEVERAEGITWPFWIRRERGRGVGKTAQFPDKETH